MKRPWSGQVEKSNEEATPEFDTTVSNYFIYISNLKTFFTYDIVNKIYEGVKLIRYLKG